MDFGNFEPLKNPAAYVSSDVLIYQPGGRDGSPLKVLTGVRIGTPWDGYLTIPFGGYIDPGDTDPVSAAVREVKEETTYKMVGKFQAMLGLDVTPEFLIGVYGPERWHYTLAPSDYPERLAPLRTSEKGHIRPVVAFCFAGRVRGGQLSESAEQKGFKWRTAQEILECGIEPAFDHGLVLADFLQAIDGARSKGSLLLFREPVTAISSVR